MEKENINTEDLKNENLEGEQITETEDTSKDVEENVEETAEEAEVLEDKEFEEVISIEDVLKGKNSKLKEENTKLNNEVEALKERLVRLSAEYENFRKRSQKEKEGIYTDACYDVIKEVLPTLDNLERAVSVDGSVDDLKKGIEMTIRGFKGSLEKLGVEEIDASGDFDPNLHQAVMHDQDENFGPNKVSEVFQKGYKKGEKVIRYSMVKVVN
ncbi:nucleotide exchange factor GrpE [Clostridium sp. YIM B02506]|uniref:nucleotide exchange factor GrpE n=1 Tax=Clostridium sp. YIM B02506 TaxID=2910680 RepID=UPI001EEDF2BC|nr:nucleotide exchange factor GrpE [Clostridium sp. YIM B02506]